MTVSRRAFHDRLLRHRALVLVVAAGMMAGGALCLPRLGSGIYPELEFPRIVVVARSGDDPPELMQASVVRPLEEALTTVLGVRRIRTRIIRGSAEIALQFSEGSDMWRALQLADAAIANARSDLPPGVEIESEKVTPADFPIVSYNLVGADRTAQREAAEFVIRPAFSRVPGIGRVDVSGGDPREIEVALDPLKISALKLRPSEAAARVRDAIVRRAVGRVDFQRQTVAETATSAIEGAEGIARIPVASGENGPVALAEVATVFEGTPDRTLDVHAPEGDAVQISVSRMVGASAPEVVRQIQATVKSLRLPSGLRLVEVYNQGALIRESILGIRDAILIGILLTVAVLAFFLRDARAGLLAALAVPTTLLTTFLAMSALGQTLNLMSLGGMAIAIGLVIDDAIVVVEAIVLRLEAGASPREAARDGLSEILSPVVGTTVTTVVVLAPMVLLTGVVGSFFIALATTLAAAVLLSLAFAIFVLPLLADRLLRARPGLAPTAAVSKEPGMHRSSADAAAGPGTGEIRGWERSLGGEEGDRTIGGTEDSVSEQPQEGRSTGDAQGTGRSTDSGTGGSSGGGSGRTWRQERAAQGVRKPRRRGGRLATRYARLLSRVLRRRFLVLVAAGAAIALGAGLVPVLSSGFLPEMDEGAFVLDYFLPAGTSLETTSATALRIETILGETEGIAGWARRTGAELGPVTATLLNTGDIQVQLAPRKTRDGAEEIMDRVRTRLETEMPGVRAEYIQLLEDVLSDLSGAPRPVEIKILGSDQAVLVSLAKQVASKLEGTPRLEDYYAGFEDEVPVRRFRIDPDAASRASLTPSAVAEDLEVALRGEIVGAIPRLDRLVPVRVRFDDRFRFDPESIDSLPIAAGGAVLPVSRLAPFARESGASVLYRENLVPVAPASCDVEGGDLGAIAREIRRRLAGIELPAGYRIELGGRVEGQARAFAQIAMILGLGLFAVFAVLVAQLRSIRAAILVLLTIPPALAGASILLAATRVPLNVSSMMGVVLLVGLVVKNGILLLQVALERMHEGIPLRPALVGAARRRLRPILMTTLCTVFGLVPLALSLGAGSELQRPLAIVVIGGLVFSTLATLFLLPVLAGAVLGGADRV